MPIDYNKYPTNWKTEIVPRILKRAENKCERCGTAKNGQTLYSVPKWIKCVENHAPRYKRKLFWFHDIGDALRFADFREDAIKKIKVVLTIAHLDHDETNLDVQDERLMAMCQWCHLNYDAKEKYRRVCNRVI